MLTYCCAALMHNCYSVDLLFAERYGNMIAYYQIKFISSSYLSKLFKMSCTTKI